MEGVCEAQGVRGSMVRGHFSLHPFVWQLTLRRDIRGEERTGQRVLPNLPHKYPPCTAHPLLHLLGVCLQVTIQRRRGALDDDW